MQFSHDFSTYKIIFAQHILFLYIFKFPQLKCMNLRLIVVFYNFLNNGVELLTQVGGAALSSTLILNCLCIIKKCHLSLIPTLIIIPSLSRGTQYIICAYNPTIVVGPLPPFLLLQFCCGYIEALAIFNPSSLFIQSKFENVEAVLAKLDQLLPLLTLSFRHLRFLFLEVYHNSPQSFLISLKVLNS